MTGKADFGMRNRPLAWASLAVGAGCALLFILGAPPRTPMVNGAALLIALLGVAAIGTIRRFGASATWGDSALILASALVPLTALVGPQSDGVARWLVIGGLTIQPAMIVVPLIALGVALRPSTPRTAAAIIAALGLAMQPDPGAAAMLLAGLATPLLDKDRSRPSDSAGAVTAAIALAVAEWRTVDLPPVPFVEHVIPDAFAAGVLPTMLAMAAALLMLVPAVARPLRAPHFAHLGLWIAALATALIGPYPTPVVGFGGSGVLGFVMSAGLLALGTRVPRP